MKLRCIKLSSNQLINKLIKQKAPQKHVDSSLNDLVVDGLPGLSDGKNFSLIQRNDRSLKLVTLIAVWGPPRLGLFVVCWENSPN